MTQSIKAVLFSSLFLLSGCAGLPKNGAPITLLKNVNLIDGIKDAAINSQTVVIEGNIIADIYPTGSVPSPKHAIVIDLSGDTLLPGLINGHVHLTPNPKKQLALDAMLQSGVTTVRDLGGNAKLVGSLTQSTEPVPTLAYSATVFGLGFMNDPRVEKASAPLQAGQAPWMQLIEPDTNIESVVREAKNAGVSGLKLYASLTPKSLEGITSEAHKQGLKVWAHSVIFPSGPSDIVAAGVDQIVHAKGLAALGQDNIPNTFAEGIRKWTPELDFNSIDPLSDKFQKLFSKMVMKETILEPALIADGDVVMLKRPLSEWQSAQRAWACRATKAANDAGVVISAGTDFFGEEGLLFLELERLVECGLTPMDAIKAATVNNAAAIGLAKQLGTIEIGKIADLLVVDGDPSTSIEKLRQTRLVMKNGTIVKDGISIDVSSE